MLFGVYIEGVPVVHFVYRHEDFSLLPYLLFTLYTHEHFPLFKSTF